MLYKHVNNTDVAVELLKFIRIPGKKYARIKVKWYNIGPHAWYSLGITQWLTDASIVGNKKERGKYSLSKWRTEWQSIEESEC